ncbi:MAG TPA: hypothetical protein VL651_04950 [Bacteroidia bacterium]|jgi:hypothetical protein|nr:hypothetical protein [Bacteroidia bacterium]
MKNLITRNAELSFDEETGLLHIRMLEGADLNLENTIAHYNAIREITGGKKYFALIDAKEYFTMSAEALRYTSSKEVTENRIAAAHYNSAAANKLTADFFRKYYKPPIPIRVIDSKEEAIAWLLSGDHESGEN